MSGPNTRAPNGAPQQLVQVAELMSAFPSDWYLCGGWAVDAWLGRITRDHGDLDITVFEDAGTALRKHLSGWQLVAHDQGVDGGGSSEEWDGRPLTLPAHLHCRAPENRGSIPEDGILMSDQGWWLEIVINAREHGEWVLYDDPRVTIPLDACSAQSGSGLPAALPEVLLFFKATAYKGTRHYLRPRDHVDFERLLPRLNSKQRAWLIESIARVEADHPWLGVLAS